MTMTLRKAAVILRKTLNSLCETERMVCEMLYEVKVPQQGETTEYVTVSKWNVKAGDTVHKDDELGEMESAKTVAPIVAPCDGVVAKILKDDGDAADIGATLLLIEG